MKLNIWPGIAASTYAASLSRMWSVDGGTLRRMLAKRFGNSMYMPHQSERERARRVRQRGGVA